MHLFVWFLIPLYVDAYSSGVNDSSLFSIQHAKLEIQTIHVIVGILFTEWSRTATQKTTKKSSVTRLTSLQSSESAKSNNSSSSTSFLVSDASDQITGISE